MNVVTLFSLIPDPETVLAMEPEELSGYVLHYLNSLLPMQRGQLNRYNFGLPHTVNEYPSHYHEQLSCAFMEAWVWLESEGLIATKPGGHGDWVFITRRGKKLASAEGLKKYRMRNLLPKRFLHPRISQKIWAIFLRGDYETAVFQSFNELEVRVREVGGFEATDYGEALMEKAFEAERGALCNRQASKAEQTALCQLFAGAVGSYKNPHSHRNAAINAKEGVEMIILASHLLHIVDKRAAEGSQEPSGSAVPGDAI
jgi:uncharacterized protein (TIGR02391 family)